MPERLECEVLQKERYINTLTFTTLPISGLENQLRICWLVQYDARLSVGMCNDE